MMRAVVDPRRQHDADRPGRTAAFTLIELLVVIAIIGIFAGVIGLAFRNAGSDTSGLRTARSTLVGLLDLARSQAALSGRNAALFVHADPGNADRYQRFLVVAVIDEEGAWNPVADGVLLPAGVYVVPYSAPSGDSIETGADWTELGSTRLATAETCALLSGTAENWVRVAFTPRGTASPSVGVGDQIVLCTGRPQPDNATYPVVFTNPDNVRGVSISSYGQVTLLDSREDF